MYKMSIKNKINMFTIKRKKKEELKQKKEEVNKNLVDSKKIVEEYLNKSNWRVKENANMSYAVQWLNNYIASKVSAKYWLDQYPSHIAEAHRNWDFHLHDLSMIGNYCCWWDLKELLIKWFWGVAEKHYSKPPKHFRSALGQLVNFLYTLQGEANWAQAVASFDTFLAPFIKYDELDYRQVKQAIQEFVFNLNVPTRVGFQSPFTNITLDVSPSKELWEQNVIVWWEIKEEKYNDFQKEMDMINKALWQVFLEWDAKWRPFSFPIPTYNIDKDFPWDKECLEPIMRATAKYWIPYFANFIWSWKDKDAIRSMCCRLSLDMTEIKKRWGWLFWSDPLTWSIWVVTLNMARIWYLSKNEYDFTQRVFKLMDMAKEALEIKRVMLEKYMEDWLYPYSRHYLEWIKKRFGKYWSNHFSTIWINWMNEALINFFWKDIASDEWIEFTNNIMNLMNERLKEYQEETGNLYNLEATPAEWASYRFALSDKEKYPKIICANEPAYRKWAKPYYTNSTHVPVDYTDDLFTLLDKQNDIQALYSWGTVIHIFLWSKVDDIETIKKLIKTVFTKYKVPYISITPTFSICEKHWYLEWEQHYCPKCAKEDWQE